MSEMSTFTYGLVVTLFGMVIVFLVLIALWGILAMMRFFGGKNKQQKNQDLQQDFTPAAVAMTAAEVVVEDTDSNEIIAVISAAIAACMGSQSNLVVTKITRIGDSTPVWGQIGRHEQMLNRF